MLVGKGPLVPVGATEPVEPVGKGKPVPVGNGRTDGYMPEGKMPEGKAGEEVEKMASADEEEATTIVEAAELDEAGASATVLIVEAVTVEEETVPFAPLN